MNIASFQASLENNQPPDGISVCLQVLWWDAKGDWTQAHQLVDELETPEAMAVHAYMHRKAGEEWNANYWYRLAGRNFYREQLDEEWKAIVESLLL